MNARTGSLVAISLLAAAACIRLGIWQLDRLGERRTFNAVLAERLASPPASLLQLPADTGSAHYRRVAVSGTYDYANEIALTNRIRNGSPGVNIITPLRQAGTDTAILVNRGWVYAGDGMSVDLSRWHEGTAAGGTAYVETFSGPRRGAISSPSRHRTFRWLDRGVLSPEFPYAIAPYYLVLIAGSADTAANIPPRLGQPLLDDGPHRSYAIQWFSFAAISIIGMFLFVRRK